MIPRQLCYELLSQLGTFCLIYKTISLGKAPPPQKTGSFGNFSQMSDLPPSPLLGKSSQKYRLFFWLASLRGDFLKITVFLGGGASLIQEIILSARYFSLYNHKIYEGWQVKTVFTEQPGKL